MPSIQPNNQASRMLTAMSLIANIAVMQYAFTHSSRLYLFLVVTIPAFLVTLYYTRKQNQRKPKERKLKRLS